MSPIYAITKLATLIMVVDNDADQEELDILNKLPQRMAAHIEGRSGVTFSITISIGGSSSSSSKSYDDMNEESEHVISPEEIAEVANQTIQDYNDTEEKDLDDWIKSITDSLNSDDIKSITINLNSLVNNLNSITTSLKNSEGTAGKLINDKSIYDNLENATNQLNRLIEDIKLNPNRYINFSVFGKKNK